MRDMKYGAWDVFIGRNWVFLALIIFLVYEIAKRG